VLTDGERKYVMESLTGVGHRKAVGYLPLRTITCVLESSMESVQRELAVRGLRTISLDETEACIKSGALFAFSEPMLLKEIAKFRAEIERRGWQAEPTFVVRRIAEEWFGEDDPIMPFIKAVYGEHVDE
jgi:hypothetical protein